MSRTGLLSFVACLYLVFAGGVSSHTAMTAEEKSRMREQVLEMFRHAYNSYMDHAYPADELMPLSCKGRVRGVDASRGDVDDALGKFSLTLIDTLDTLAVLGEIEEFEKAVKLVLRDVSFDNDVVVSVFETNIRVLGGLLGGHFAALALKSTGKGMSWYNGELVDMAKEVGYRLLPAFNTTTGIPYPRVNLRYGIHHPSSGTGSESDTCTACAGTMIMEFGALSRLTGEPIFEAKAQKAMESIWVYRSRASDLVGTVINIHNGDWVRRDSGVGAGIDSYYEYCLKAYILLGDDTYLERFNKHYKSIMQYMNRGPLFLSVQMHQPDRTVHAYMDALQAFWPGLQVLKGDVQKAIETHQMLFEVSKKHTFLPEAFTTDFEVHWGQHPLRPELLESTYFLYEATSDPYYLEVGKHIVEKINEHARVPCGFAALRDVRTLSHEDRMDSFVLAETFKYLYLLFTEKEDVVLNMNQFIFTTEAHLLPLSLSTMAVNESASQELKYNVTLSTENEHEYTCPFTRHKEGSSIKFAEEVRRKSRVEAQESCPNKKAFSFSSERPPRLRAEQFVPGNQQHVAVLKSMGIVVVQMKDGRIQLMQTASTAISDGPNEIEDVSSFSIFVAHSQAHAEDGIKFMQEMIELAKQRNDESSLPQNPRVVQLMSAPYMGDVILNAGPAQFGLDLSRGDVGMGAEVAITDPIKGCSSPTNAEELKHRIAIMERGECMFIDKARHAETVGAVGVIIIDNNEGSSSDSQPIFAMAGDGSSNDVKIPAVLLFSEEGRILNNAIDALADSNRRLTVRLAAKASGTDNKVIPFAGQQKESSSSSDESEKQHNETVASGDTEPNADKVDPPVSPSVKNTRTYSSCSGQECEGLQDKPLQTDSTHNEEESTHSTEADEDTAVPLNPRTVAVGKNEVFCTSTGKPCPGESNVYHTDSHQDTADVTSQGETLDGSSEEAIEGENTKNSESLNSDFSNDNVREGTASLETNQNAGSDSYLQGSDGENVDSANSHSSSQEELRDTPTLGSQQSAENAEESDNELSAQQLADSDQSTKRT